MPDHLLPYHPRSCFVPFHRRTQRWACLVAHRRAGKTVAAINDLIRRALGEPGSQPGQYAFIAPYRAQAKAVAWDYGKYYAGPAIAAVNESELTIRLITGATLRLAGADNADSLRGLGFDHVYLDEYGDFKPSVWGTVIRPALSDRQGGAVFGGTPKGRNAFFDIREIARQAPDWHYTELRASQSGLLPPGELAAAREQLSADQYDQEYECSFEAAIIGAYYGTEMRELTDAGRICDVPHQPDLPVHTAWDLGWTDDTAIWFFQLLRGEIHILGYHGVSGATIDDLAEAVKSRGYRLGKLFLPHDAKAKTLAAAGKSIIEQMAAHFGAASLVIVPSLSVQDGIQAARKMLPRTWFDRSAADGIEALRQYRREYDEDRKAFRDRPAHDFCSHAADAFRMLAIAATDPKPDVVLAQPERPLLVGARNSATLNDMWAAHAQVERRRRI